MYGVGSVGRVIANSIHTVSGPFHPFGGAVDIIVVQQEDGTFKSTPWYVKFGKFQGVLKNRGKSVAVAVNDGDASFHMYLDHKGEAYFLKDAQGDDAAAFSPAEATSSGDEGPHTLAPEYPRGDEGSDERAEHGKDESEDERGDDLELRFEGREASKQLIQEERKTVALAREEDILSPGNSSGDLGILQGSSDGVQSSTITDVLVSQVVGSQVSRKSKSARAYVASARAHKVAVLGDGASPQDVPGGGPKTADRNGMIIHCLLNHAVGRRPAGKSAPAAALVAGAALASLRRVVSGSPQSDASSNISPSQFKLAELGDADVNSAKSNHEYAVRGTPSGELAGERQEQVLVEDPLSRSVARGPLPSSGSSSHDVGTKLVSSLPGPDSDGDETELRQPFVDDPPPPEALDATTTLEVRKVEVCDKSLVVEVQEHVEKVIDGVLTRGDGAHSSSEAVDDKLETIVIDRKQLLDEVIDVGKSAEVTSKIESDDSQKLEVIREQDMLSEEVDDPDVRVNVNKQFVKNLNDALLPSGHDGREKSSEVVKSIESSGTEGPLISSENAGDFDTPEATGTGEKILSADSEIAPVKMKDGETGFPPIITTPVKELALANPAGFTDVGSPRLKAAIDIEMAWRDVMQNAATSLKGAPYTSKERYHSQLSKKKSFGESGQKKRDGSSEMRRESSEKKSWGDWFWGGSSAPQVKQNSEDGDSKDVKKVGSGTERGVASLENDKSGGLSFAEQRSENVKDSGADAKQNVELGPPIADERGSKSGDPRQSDSEGGRGDRKSAGSDNVVSRGKVDGESEVTSNGVAEPKSQGELSSRRRSLFGLLSRSGSNPPLPSNASSPRSGESPQPLAVGLNRTSSLERADDVMDLLETRWEKGSRGSRAASVPISKGQDAPNIAEEIHRNEVEDTASVVQNQHRLSQQGEEEKNLIAVRNLEEDTKDSARADGFGSSVPVVLIAPTDAAESTRKGLSPKESGFSAPEGDQVTPLKAELKDSSSRPPRSNSTGHWLDEEVFSTPASDVGPGQIASSPTPTPSTDVVLFSVDGCIITAPLNDDEDGPPPVFPEAHEKLPVEDPESSIEGGTRSSPCRAVSVAGPSMPASKSPNGSSDTNQLPTYILLPVQPEVCSPHGYGTQETDCPKPHDGVHGSIVAGPGCEGLKGLARLADNDEVRKKQFRSKRSYAHDMDSSSTESKQNDLRVTLDTEPAAEIDGDAKDTGHDSAGKGIREVRASAFERLDEVDDMDDHDHNQSMDMEDMREDLAEALTAGDVTAGKVLRRNKTVYLDAVDGENEQESIQFPFEDDQDRQWGSTTSPIEIPGANGRARNFTPSSTHALRTTSESLPNARHHIDDSGMASSKLQLSRSLDSASHCAPERRVETPDFGGLRGARLEGDNAVTKLQGEDSHDPGNESRTTGTTSGSVDGRGMVAAGTGFELSLCRHLLNERMGTESAAQVFASEKVTLEEFIKSGSAIAANSKLVVRVGGCYYPWEVASPIVLGILAFGQVLIAPSEGAIAVEQPIVAYDGNAVPSPLRTVSSGGWKIWPFGSMRRPKTPEKGSADAIVSRDEFLLATEAALKNKLAEEYLASKYKRPRKVRTNSPSSQQLASLNLGEGSNKITFTFVTRMLGKQQVDARIYLWKWNTRIVISDVDGTITKSDVLGQVMPLMGKDWTQSGVARLFSAIKKNGYELMFLSARAISQAYLTRTFLENIKQDGEVLPDGPVVISPDGLFPSLYREVIRRAPHEFKIACLEDIKSLFPSESKPFYAGFGNRDTDELSYLKVGITKGKIFIINPKGEVVVNNRVDVKSYTSLHKLVDDMFPSMTFTEEDYNEWNYWKLPLPDIEDEPIVKSSGSSNAKRGGKSARHS